MQYQRPIVVTNPTQLFEAVAAATPKKVSGPSAHPLGAKTADDFALTTNAMATLEVTAKIFDSRVGHRQLFHPVGMSFDPGTGFTMSICGRRHPARYARTCSECFGNFLTKGICAHGHTLTLCGLTHMLSLVREVIEHRGMSEVLVCSWTTF